MREDIEHMLVHSGFDRVCASNVGQAFFFLTDERKSGERAEGCESLLWFGICQVSLKGTYYGNIAF